MKIKELFESDSLEAAEKITEFLEGEGLKKIEAFYRTYTNYVILDSKDISITIESRDNELQVIMGQGHDRDYNDVELHDLHDDDDIKNEIKNLVRTKSQEQFKPFFDLAQKFESFANSTFGNCTHYAEISSYVDHHLNGKIFPIEIIRLLKTPIHKARIIFCINFD